MIRLLPRFPSCVVGVVGLVLAAGSMPARADGPRPASTMLAQNDADAPDDPASASAFLVRIERLENRLQTMTGQIEQLQNQNQRLQDQLRKMQQDVDFRFQDLGRGSATPPGRPVPLKRGDAGDASPPETSVAVTTPDTEAVNPAPAKPTRHAGDAFDPAAVPEAPGAPRPLGTTPPSEPLTLRATPTEGAAPRAPLDLTPRTKDATTATAPDEPPPARTGVTASAPRPAPAPDTSTVASLLPGGTRGEYDADLSLFKDGQYDAAATGFGAFVQKYPRDRLVPEATYLLGESYARLGRQREAAEQFLKVSTDYTRSARAPDALLRLGVALNALGAKEQACATYQEVGRKYPTASPDVRAGVDRELKRSRCTP